MSRASLSASKGEVSLLRRPLQFSEVHTLITLLKKLEQSRKTAAKGSPCAVACSASAASEKASSKAPLPTGVSPWLVQNARQSVMRCFCHAAQNL
eukprot:6464693-Amphidinium_carterae.1